MRPAPLVLCAFLAAGCGGASLQTIAHKQAEYYGSPHAAITRVDERISSAIVARERPRTQYASSDRKR